MAGLTAKKTVAVLNKAISLHQDGELEAAGRLYRRVLKTQPKNAEALHLLGVAVTQSGKPERGAELIQRALRVDADNPFFLNNLAAALQQSGRLDEAERALRRAVRRRPTPAESFLHLGNVLRDRGMGREAMDHYRQALEIKEDYPDAHYNIACLHLGHGDLDEAAEGFRTALKGKPDHTRALNNLGATLAQMGDLEGAEQAYRRVLEIDPGSEGASTNLGRVLSDRGDAMGAFDVLWRAIQWDPDRQASWLAFTRLFARLEFSRVADEEQLRNILLACLLRDGLDHQKLATAAKRILERHTPFRELLDMVRAGTDAAFEEELASGRAFKVLSERVIRLLLERVVVPDLDFERLLTVVRRFLLRLAGREDGSGHWIFQHPGLVYTLARQCHLNGYVFSESQEEMSLVQRLADELGERGGGLWSGPHRQIRIGILACYVPLLDWDRVLDVVELATAHPDPEFVSVLVQQIEEPLYEQQLREQIPVFGELQGEVSSRVQVQYEEHPYPRWTSLDRVEPKSVKQVMQNLFPGFPLDGLAVDGSPKILVAGCGTGCDPLGVHFRFRDAEILGVDLSLSSLAYALRKSRELGVENLALMQGDILALDGWTEPFDMVEANGVLHHMENPVVGWRILTHLLKPGGLMRIGLYSEIARRQVVEARQLIARQGYEATDDDIRRCRRELAVLFGDREERGIIDWRDFYSIQECRDLLFHVQEHRFTLPQIAEIIRDLGLEFVGFELPSSNVRQNFRARFPDPRAERSLDAWHHYEVEHPDTFVGMYQFWLVKPV